MSFPCDLGHGHTWVAQTLFEKIGILVVVDGTRGSKNRYNPTYQYVCMTVCMCVSTHPPTTLPWTRVGAAAVTLLSAEHFTETTACM